MKKNKDYLKGKFDSLELESQYQALIEEAYNLSQTDAGLSDYAAYEASKIFPGSEKQENPGFS